MRLIKVGFAILLLFAITFSAANPALANYHMAGDPVKLQIQNKTGIEVSLTLRGPNSYYLQLTSGKNVVEVTPGKYSYSYQACGTSNSGNINVKKGGPNLVLPKCGKGGEGGETPTGPLVNLHIWNWTSKKLIVKLIGPVNYTFTLLYGEDSTFRVVAGTYRYKVTACGNSKSGNVVITNGKNWFWWCY